MVHFIIFTHVIGAELAEIFNFYKLLLKILKYSHLWHNYHFCVVGQKKKESLLYSSVHAFSYEILLDMAFCTFFQGQLRPWALTMTVKSNA